MPQSPRVRSKTPAQKKAATKATPELPKSKPSSGEVTFASLSQPLAFADILSAPLSVFLIALDFLFGVIYAVISFSWLAQFSAPYKYSVGVGEETENTGMPRRAASSPDKLVTSIYDGGKAETVYDMTRAAVRDNAKNVALVSRRFKGIVKTGPGDRFGTKVYDDDLDEVTYESLGEQILHFGAGLRALGMEPIPELEEEEPFDDAEGPFVMVSIFFNAVVLFSLSLV